MVSLKDIASACGVSIATVSKAINDHSDISITTKERIREEKFKKLLKRWDIFLTLRQEH